uniref:Target SNARE coiled-coil region domain containing protein n=1 Tax=Haemonchus contortus TaxID=6289 RepID=A0A7I4YEE5_HAECO
MPVKDRLSSLKKRAPVGDEEIQVMSSLISEMEQQTTDEFLRRVSSLREVVGEMNGGLELIRQMHNLLKYSTDSPDRARLRLLYDELSRVFKQFSDDLDAVVKTVNGLHDEITASAEPKSAHYRMRKDQLDSLRTSLHSLILQFREEEVPFEQETKPDVEKQLREFQIKPSAEFVGDEARNEVDESESTDNSLGRSHEVGDVEKAAESATAIDDTNPPPSLMCVEIDESKGESDEKAVLIEVKERNEGILRLEEAVSTLNSLHEHLNFLVHTQNPILNRIDVNISQATEYTAKVMNDTAEAVKLNAQAREKSFLVFFMLGVLLFILIVMVITFIKLYIARTR